MVTTYSKEVTDMCTIYFNMFSLFFNNHCNSTAWTLGYAVPYNVRELYKKYKIGYGILTMQGKESKHSAIKQELKSCTNRSKSEGPNNKWHQIMRSSYVRNFYFRTVTPLICIVHTMIHVTPKWGFSKLVYAIVN